MVRFWLSQAKQLQHWQWRVACGFACALVLGLSPAFAAPALAQGASTAEGDAAEPISAYTEAMNAGYAATAMGDHRTALAHFEDALLERPGDRYATAAIANMRRYIAAEDAEIARLEALAAARTTVDAAVAANDWACAAATVDRMLQLVPANSLEAANLLAYRGTLSGFLRAETDIARWGSVCPGPI